MAPQGGDTSPVVQLRQDLDGLAGPDAEGLAEGCQGLVQFLEALGRKVPLPGRGIGLGPETRLYDVQGQDRPGPDRHSQGTVVDNPQVALEPDDL
jgi:hypothetical protein